MFEGVKEAKEWSIPGANNCVREKCPELSGSIKLIFSIEAFSKIVALTRKIKDYEWGAYLVGEQKDAKTFYIKDLVIPKQKVSKASVEFEEENFPENCIGWIHSHNTMKAYLSETDISTASVYKVSVVVNNDLEFAAGCKINLPCGRVGLLIDEKPEIEIEDANIDLSNITRIEEKVEEPKRIAISVCPVCGQKVSTRKGIECEYCGELVHRKCATMFRGILVCKKCADYLSERDEILSVYREPRNYEWFW